MLLIVLVVLFMLYVIFSLSTIKYQLKSIVKHLDIKEKEIVKISNEEIEKELEDWTKQQQSLRKEPQRNIRGQNCHEAVKNMTLIFTTTWKVLIGSIVAEVIDSIELLRCQGVPLAIRPESFAASLMVSATPVKAPSLNVFTGYNAQFILHIQDALSRLIKKTKCFMCPS